MAQEACGEFRDDVLVFRRVFVLVLAGLLILFRAFLSGLGTVEMFEAVGIQTEQAIHELVKGNPGFAGIENELYYADKTLMVFGDAKAVVGDLVKHLSIEGRS